MSGHILLAVETPTQRIALRAVLAAARYRVASTGTEEEALDEARARTPDLMIVDEALALDNGGALLSRWRGNPCTSRIPVLVLMASVDPEARLRALRAGADDIVGGTAARAGLLARVRCQLRAADTAEALGRRQATVRDLGFAEPRSAFEAPARIALIAHDTARAECWKDLVAASVAHPLVTMSVGEALGEADREMAADLFVIEAALAHPAEALGLLADLRSRPRTRHSAILVVHDPLDQQTATMALDMGASDLLEAGFHPEELSLRLDNQLRRKREADRLRQTVDEGLRLAVLDPLTGLFNRRYALAHVDRVMRAPGRPEGYCIIMADIDRFKSINDTFGHRAGDAVISAVASRLRDNVRGMDMVARIGGEEFLIFLPDPDAGKAEAAALRLRDILHDAPMDLPDGRAPITVTASFGVARGHAEETLERVIERADRALYKAKSDGRDRVSIDRTEAA